MKLIRLTTVKKMLALLLVLSVLSVSFISVMDVLAAGCDYTVDSDFEGEGIADKPYLITSPEELYALAKMSDSETWNKYYKLTSDIILNDTSDENWYQDSGVKHWATGGAFAGYLDGDGHTVTGLYINISEEKAGYYGLFGELKDPCEISELTVDESYIYIGAAEAEAYAGTIGGFVANGASIKKCYIGEDVMLTARRAGGLIGGGASNTLIDSCAFVGTIGDFEHTDLRRGGLAGDVWSGTLTVSNSFTTYTDTASINWLGAESYSLSYCTGTSLSGLEAVAAENMKGSAAKTNMPKLNWNNVWAVSDGYPVYIQFDIWDGTADDSWKTTGDGTESKPYLIDNAAQLYDVVKSGKDITNGKYFRLETNLYLNQTGEEDWYEENGLNQWYSTAEENDLFAGDFDGNGYTVYGLYYNTDKVGNYGLFPQANAVIENLTVDKAYLNLTKANAAGALVGSDVDGKLKIERCYVGSGVSIVADESKISSEPPLEGDTVVVSNNYDEADREYVSSGTNFQDQRTMLDSTVISSDGAAVYEYSEGNKVMKITALATRMNTWPAQFSLMKADGEDFRPELNRKYKISFKYLVKTGIAETVNVELRWEKDNDRHVNCSQYDEFIADNLLAVPANETHTEWQTFEKEITLTSKPDGATDVFIALSDGKTWSGGEWYRSQFEMWIDDITVTAISDGSQVPGEVDSKIGGIVGSVSGNTEIISTAFIGNLGSSSGRALKMTRVSYLEDQWASSVKIMNSDNTAFHPDKNTNYKLSFKYRVVNPVTDRDAKIELRYTNAAGNIQLDYNNVVTYKHIIGTVCTIKQNESHTDWQTAEFEFSTGDTFGLIGDVAQLYLTLTDTDTKSTQWRSSIELLIDDIQFSSEGVIKAENNFDTCPLGGRTDFYNADCETSVITGGIQNNSGFGFAADVAENAALAVKDSFTATEQAAGGKGNASYTAAYCIKQTAPGLTSIPVTLMSGLKIQYEGMPLLDWGVSWKTTESYPVLVTEDDIFGTVGTVWSGKAATWLSGDGSEEHPFIVDTPERLYTMVSSPIAGANYSITEDIRLNETSSPEWYKGENLNEWFETTGTTFSAIVDSNKKDGTLATVSGMYNTGVTGRCALIPTPDSGSEIRNIRIKDAYLSAEYDPETMTDGGSIIAGIACYVDGSGISKIENCIVEESVILDGGWRQGGVIACVGGNAYVANCAFRGVLNGNYGYTGGIIGDMWGSAQVSQCYTVGSQVVEKFDANRGRVDRCYSNLDAYATHSGPYHSRNIIRLSENNMSGLSAAERMNGLDFNNVWSATGGYPDILKKVELSDGLKNTVWSGKEAVSYASGDGTQENPYIIETGEQLYKLLKDKSTEGKYYELGADIVLNETNGEYWYEEDGLNAWATNWITSFKGNFDGNYHTVTGLYMGLADGQNVVSGLIPYACDGAVIKNVGLVNSALNLTGLNVAGSIVGTVKSGNVTVSECFGTADVILEGNITGGIVGHVPYGSAVSISNCAFTGDTAGENAVSGAIIGSLEGSDSKVDSSFGSTAKNSRFIGGSADAEITDSYYYGSYAIDGVVALRYAERIGFEAETLMNKLDFKDTWLAVDGGTPVLRRFADPERYSDKSIRISTITFDTGDPSTVIMPYTAEIDSKLNMPTPTRKGYIFDGWYIYPEFDIPFELESMPICDMTVYAKWIVDSVIEDFEDYSATDYDMGSDYQHYKPGARGYNTNYTHGGFKSMHRLGDTDDEQDFLLNYETPLVKGQEYVMTFWALLDDDKNVDISLVYNTWPDINDPNIGIEKITTVESGSYGEWTEITYKFVALSEYVSIRTSGGASIYFDDFMLIATQSPLVDVSDLIKPAVDNDEPQRDTAPDSTEPDISDDDNGNKIYKKIITEKPVGSGDDSSSDNLWIYIVGVILGIVVLAGAAVVIIVAVKRYRKREI